MTLGIFALSLDESKRLTIQHEALLSAFCMSLEIVGLGLKVAQPMAFVTLTTGPEGFNLVIVTRGEAEKLSSRMDYFGMGATTEPSLMGGAALRVKRL